MLSLIFSEFIALDSLAPFTKLPGYASRARGGFFD